MNLEKRPFTPIRKNKEPLSKRSSLKLSYNGLSPSPSKINSRIKDKQTVQTLMTAKSTYVEQLCNIYHYPSPQQHQLVCVRLQEIHLPGVQREVPTRSGVHHQDNDHHRLHRVH